MSSLRTSLSVMRPPKPPCWRDFISPTPKSIQSEGVDVPDPPGRAMGARSPIAELVDASRAGSKSLPGNKPSKLVRRPRARIHRTRSEHVIDAQDLPDSAFTATLADTEPKGVRARRQAEDEGRLYVEENNRRCQNWLASIEACEPLDEVDYTSDSGSQQSKPGSDQRTSGDAHGRVDPPSGSGTETDERVVNRVIHPELIPIYETDVGVDVEVPEETFGWSVPQELLSGPPSSGDEGCCTCTKTSASRADSKQKNNSARKGHENISKHADAKLEPAKGKSADAPCKTIRFAKTVNIKRPQKLSCDAEQDNTNRIAGVESETKCLNKAANIDEANRRGNTCRNVEPKELSDIQEVSNANPDRRGLTSSIKRASSRNVLNDEDLWALSQLSSE